MFANFVIPGKNFGLHSEETAGGDAFILITLAFLFFVLGIGVISAWILWKRQHHPLPHMQLLMEIEQEAQLTAPVEPTAQSGSSEQAWEKDPDWWRKES
jgi:hypothetical protein